MLPPDLSTSSLDHAATILDQLFPQSSTLIATEPSPTAAVLQIATIMISSTPTILHSLTSSSTPFATLSPSVSPQDIPQDTGECELLGPFAILVQAALGGLALLSLVYKRWRERPQRPIKIWAFDASKQVVGSVLLHLANLVMSMFSAGQIQVPVAQAAASAARANGEEYQPNPCSFYLLNLAIDTTLGIPILIIILRLLTAGATLTPLAHPPESIQSGHYGTPPRATWWLKQSLIYFIGLLCMKTCVFIIFELLPWIVQVGDWALRWTEGNEAVQIAFVMLIFPLIMNALQYYIIDSFIKNNKATAAEVDEGDAVGEDDALLAGDDSLEQEEARKEDAQTATTKGTPKESSRSLLNAEHDLDHHTPEASSSASGSRIEADALSRKLGR